MKVTPEELIQFLEHERELHPFEMDVGTYFADYLGVAKKRDLAPLRALREELLRQQQEGQERLRITKLSYDAFAKHGVMSEAEKSMLKMETTRAYKEDIQPPAKQRRLLEMVMRLYTEGQLTLGFKIIEEFSDKHRLFVVDQGLHDAIEVLASVMLDTSKPPRSLSEAYGEADDILRKQGSFPNDKKPTDSNDSVGKRLIRGFDTESIPYPHRARHKLSMKEAVAMMVAMLKGWRKNGRPGMIEAGKEWIDNRESRTENGTN